MRHLPIPIIAFLTLEVILKKWMIIFSLFVISQFTYGEEIDLTKFGQSYFKAWKATQSPYAKKKDLEHYLSFLADDVGHQHIPYDNDDSRLPSGKQDIRKGMTFFLGSHQTYSAKLNNVIPAHNAVVITYMTSSSGIHPQTGEKMSLNYATMEVLEIENGKVSVIRKYEE